MAKDNMIAKGVRMPQEMGDMCDTMTKKTSESSRNELIRRAVEFYIEYLNHERFVEFLTPALESVIDGKIKDSEDRIARIIFKLAVDQNFLAHLIGNRSRAHALGLLIAGIKQRICLEGLAPDNVELAAR